VGFERILREGTSREGSGACGKDVSCSKKGGKHERFPIFQKSAGFPFSSGLLEGLKTCRRQDRREGVGGGVAKEGETGSLYVQQSCFLGGRKGNAQKE